MTSLRRIGAVAAIGTLAAASTLLTGLAAAGAQQLSSAVPSAAAATATGTDELSQLRANNELLQQRLDQLAQVGLAHPNVPPGTASLAGSFPRSFLIPGTDTSLQVGGQVELDTDYFVTGGNNNQTGAGTSIIGVPGLSSVALDVPGSSDAARARGKNIFAYTVYASRLHVETRTPTPYGQAQTVVEIDFLGCSLGGIVCNNTVAGQDGLGLRLRLAYATLGPFAFGQMWNIAFDLAAEAERLDTGGTPGDFGVGRQPEIAYTAPPIWTPAGPVTAAFALIAPEDSAATPNGGTLTNDSNAAFIGGGSLSGATLLGSETAGTIGGSGSNQPLAANPLKNEMPDAAGSLTWQQPWGHLQLHGVVHEAALVDGEFINKQFIGYGGGFSGNVKPGWLGWSKDNLTFNAFAGNGLGRYAGGGGSGNYFPYLATNYGAPAGTNPIGAAVGNPCGYGHAGGTVNATCAAGIQAQTIPEWGAQIGYQHWWTPTIRSTADVGITHQDVPTSLIGPAALQGPLFPVNKELVTVHANLIWSPVPFVNTGFEYEHGHRVTIYNSKGDQNVIEYYFVAKF